MKRIVLVGASHSALRKIESDWDKDELNDYIVHVIEPMKSNLELLDKFFKTDRIIKHDMALGAKDGTIAINLSLSWDSHSLYGMKKDFDYYWEIVKQTGDIVEVNVMTWDSFIRHAYILNVDVCIIDAEGAEGDILRNMSHTLPKEIYVSHYHSNIFEGVDSKEELLILMTDLGYKDIKELDEELYGRR